MTNADSISEKLCQAIELIADKKVSTANYDRTIQATIVSCQDESIGKYKVRYQDGYWYAYGSNIENTYSKGELVYILVPGGDMNKDKTILGSTTRMATNLTTVVNETDRFIPIGNNALPESSYELCSYFNEPVPLHPVYIRGAEGDIGSYLNPTLDAEIKEYISRGTVVDIGFTAQTNLPPQQKSAGNYGLLMNLIFKDPATEELIKREYILDIDNMQGNPYNLITQTFQHKYYDIDGANFEYIDSIYLFVQDFPEHYDTKPDDKPYDIFIKNLYFNSAELMSEQDYNSNSLVILTPKGYIFNDTDLGTDARRLQAQVRVKGKIVSENNPDLSFYWFRENSGINAANPKFSTYGKQGWECLNDHVPNKTPYEYVKGKSFYDVLKEVCYTKETKFKCVAVYGDATLSKEIIIINNDADYTITLTTDSGKTAFPENSSESPVIICNVDPAAAPSGSHYVYDWCYYDSGLVYHTILKDAATDGNITNLNTLKDFIDNNLTATDTFSYTILKYKFEETEIELLDGKTIDTVFAENSIAKNENITYGEFTEIPSTPSVATAAITLGMAIYNRLYQDERSSGNEVHNVHIPNIVNYRIYKCSVFVSNTPDDSSKIYIGTAALKIINGIDELDIDITTNKLIIENGTQVFKYNTAGVSPSAKSNKNPYQIPNLNLLIYDHEGNDITTEALRTSVIVWRVPVKHTLLDFSSTGYTLIPDPNNEDYAYIKNEPSLVYGISNKYYMNYSNNTIYVAVDYDDETLMGATNLTFLKEGISGTNGTEYSINIIFANTNDRIPYPTIYYYDNNNITCNWKSSLPRADENWFKVQLWHNGGAEPIFKGAATGNATDTDDPTSTESTVTVRWRVLFRTYPDATINHFINCSSLDDGDFSSVPYFNLDTTKITQYWNLVDGGDAQALKQNAPANLIQVKVTYKGLDYYDVLPILFSRVASGDTSYKIDLQEGTGFTEVLFDTNGTTREFDNTNPFSIQVGGGQVSDFSYQFTPVGSVRYFTSSTQTAAYTDIDYLIPTGRLDELPENQKKYEPCNRYDGQATNIGLICQIKRNGTIFGTLLIPVYFYINRYFNSALNGWDGNSIDLGQTNGGMILAPQVGAGYKEPDNSFTGVVIGTAQDPQARIDSESSAFTDRRRIEAGLFGYNKGTRSIFLDAKTGKAEFGTGNARIILDPRNDKALLFNDGYREVNNGIAQDALGKIDYSYTGQGQGLKIDLTKPEIKYGNGKFAVDQNGNITSMSGHIGGWKITEHTLQSDAQAVDENGRLLYDNDGNPVSAIYLDSLTHTIRGGTLISNFGEIGGWNISTHRLYSDDANDQETDENGNSLYRDADGNLLYKDKEDNNHLYYKEKHLLYEGEEADLIVPTHSAKTYERVQKTDKNGNLLYKDKQGVLLYKDKNDGHFYYTPQSPYTGKEEELTPSMDFIVHTEKVQDTDKKGNLLYKDGEDNIIYKDKEDELLYYKNKFSLYGDDEATVEPIMIPNIYLDSQTETIYGGTIIGSIIKSKNYTEKKDENDKIIDTVGTMINLNDSTFRFADNGLYYEDDVLYVRSLAGGTVSRIKEVLTASGYNLNIRDKDWKEEHKDVDRGYILVNNPYLQKNPDRPQEAFWYESCHYLDGEGRPSQEQKDPSSRSYDGGPHYGTLVYGEDIPKSGATAKTTGHIYRMTWDKDLSSILFYIDGQLVSTLGTGSNLGVGVSQTLSTLQNAIVTYQNDNDYNIVNTEQKIIEMTFTPANDTALFFAEIHAEGVGTSVFKYVLNGTTVNFTPSQIFTEGPQIINLFLPLTNMNVGGQNTLQVYCVMSTGTASISKKKIDARILMSVAIGNYMTFKDYEWYAYSSSHTGSWVILQGTGVPSGYTNITNFGTPKKLSFFAGRNMPAGTLADWIYECNNNRRYNIIDKNLKDTIRIYPPDSNGQIAIVGRGPGEQIFIPENCQSFFSPNYNANITNYIEQINWNNSVNWSMAKYGQYLFGANWNNLKQLDLSNIDLSNLLLMYKGGTEIYPYMTYGFFNSNFPTLQTLNLSGFKFPKGTFEYGLFKKNHSGFPTVKQVITDEKTDTSNIYGSLEDFASENVTLKDYGFLKNFHLKPTSLNNCFFNTYLSNIDLSNWDTSQVESMFYMFDSAYGEDITEIDLSKFNTTNVTTMDQMFQLCQCPNAVINLSSFDTISNNNQISTNLMFEKCRVKEIIFGDNFAFRNAGGYINYPFVGSIIRKLTIGENFFKYITNGRYTFYNIWGLKELYIPNSGALQDIVHFCYFYTSKQSMRHSSVVHMPQDYPTNWSTSQASKGGYNTIKKVTFGLNFHFTNITKATQLLLGCCSLYANATDQLVQEWKLYDALEQIHFTNFDFSQDCFLNYAFAYHPGLKIIDFGNNVNTTPLTLSDGGSAYMFYSNYSLQYLDLSKWDMSNFVHSLHFAYCRKLKTLITPYGTNVLKLIDNNDTFSYCESLEEMTIDISNSKAQVSSVFNNCKSLKTVHIIGQLNSYIKSLKNMFNNCVNLTTITFTDSWDISNITKFDYMFYNCPKLHLDWSNKTVSSSATGTNFNTGSPYVIPPAGLST